MKKKHLYGAMLWAFLVTANLCTGCSDDNNYPDVDGQNPTMTTSSPERDIDLLLKGH